MEIYLTRGKYEDRENSEALCEAGRWLTLVGTREARGYRMFSLLTWVLVTRVCPVCEILSSRHTHPRGLFYVSHIKSKFRKRGRKGEARVRAHGGALCPPVGCRTQPATAWPPATLPI